MKFLIFAGDEYYPSGGWEDFITTIDTLSNVHLYIDEIIKNNDHDYDWMHVVDMETHDIIITFRNINVGGDYMYFDDRIKNIISIYIDDKVYNIDIQYEGCKDWREDEVGIEVSKVVSLHEKKYGKKLHTRSQGGVFAGTGAPGSLKNNENQDS